MDLKFSSSQPTKLDETFLPLPLLFLILPFSFSSFPVPFPFSNYISIIFFQKARRNCAIKITRYTLRCNREGMRGWGSLVYVATAQRDTALTFQFRCMFFSRFSSACKMEDPQRFLFRQSSSSLLLSHFIFIPFYLSHLCQPLLISPTFSLNFEVQFFSFTTFFIFYSYIYLGIIFQEVRDRACPRTRLYSDSGLGTRESPPLTNPS